MEIKQKPVSWRGPGQGSAGGITVTGGDPNGEVTIDGRVIKLDEEGNGNIILYPGAYPDTKGVYNEFS